MGKTTLIEEAAGAYVSLDDQDARSRATLDPKTFLRKEISRSPAGRPAGLDESQWVPELFPALKEHVRVHKRPGQFLISGSVRFYSRLAIRESLTGRIVNTELLPFSVAELEGLPRPRLILSLLQKSRFDSTMEGELSLRVLGRWQRLFSLQEWKTPFATT